MVVQGRAPKISEKLFYLLFSPLSTGLHYSSTFLDLFLLGVPDQLIFINPSLLEEDELILNVLEPSAISNAPENFPFLTLVLSTRLCSIRESAKTISFGLRLDKNSICFR